MRNFLILLPLLAVLGTAGCNTVKGFGRDVQAGGEVITDGAADVQQDL